MRISFNSTNQNIVVLYLVTVDTSAKLTILQAPPVVITEYPKSAQAVSYPVRNSKNAVILQPAKRTLQTYGNLPRFLLSIEINAAECGMRLAFSPGD
jgi:hypothetical protein